MKKLLSVLLIAALCMSTCVCAVSADDAYPESAHDYANNSEEKWTYTYPAAAEQLYVTFSEKTAFEYEVYYSVTADDPPEKQQILLENGYYLSGEDDRLDIYDGSGALCRSAGGTSLAGRTIRIPGNSFSLVLVSDAQGTAYGFSIDRISPEPPESVAAVRYHTADETRIELVPVGEAVMLDADCKMLQDGSRMIVGWQNDSGAWYYHNVWTLDEEGYLQTDPDKTDLIAESGAEYDLYPVYCRLGMTKDEVFSFGNSSDNFDHGYYFTRAHYRQLFRNWFVTFAFSPMMPFAVLVGAFFTLLWPTLQFQGSCCGFPLTALLQHYGKLDLLSRQGVEKVSELEPDDELTSIINYYNVQTAACHPVNHLAIERGTEAYTAELHALYDTLESGTPAYFEVYRATQHPMQSLLTGKAMDIFIGNHGILLTGAYTDADGNHILIGWDNNSPAYSSGRCDVVYINADFTEIYFRGYDRTPLEGFTWNDSFEQLDAFPVEGLSNPLAWHIQLFKNGPANLQQMVSLLLRTLAAKAAQ